MTGSIFI